MRDKLGRFLSSVLARHSNVRVVTSGPCTQKDPYSSKMRDFWVISIHVSDVSGDRIFRLELEECMAKEKVVIPSYIGEVLKQWGYKELE